MIKLIISLTISLLLLTSYEYSERGITQEGNADIGINEQLQATSVSSRAFGNAKVGKLEVVSRSEEKIHTLGAPSCDGLEDDYSITANYDVLFKTGTHDLKIQELNNIEVIQPNKETIEMEKLILGETELFYFMPRYTDCHGLEFYLYGIDGDKAYPITFALNHRSLDKFHVSPIDRPNIIEDRLVFRGGYGAGMDTVSKYYFRFDQKKHQMILEKELQVRPGL
ncbi:hypothetical protein [Paenibacillus dakarensis]|uniref:hypothetical protein n=1 Tax=Paenibacillus dakarensis TaxID=1527293 RepID=UPI0006D550AE|nr:hypothetical protein [Paenibacillus dakarensis]